MMTFVSRAKFFISIAILQACILCKAEPLKTCLAPGGIPRLLNLDFGPGMIFLPNKNHTSDGGGLHSVERLDG
jgi:hypothetical protein